MDEEKKKKLNDAIAVIRAFCLNRDYCSGCPFKYNGGIADYGCDFPCNWHDIE